MPARARGDGIEEGTEAHAASRKPVARPLMHLGFLSMGAAGLLMVEMTNVTMQGGISPRCATLCTGANEAALNHVIDLCRTCGIAKLGLQRAHSGRKRSASPRAMGLARRRGADAGAGRAAHGQRTAARERR